MFYEFKYSRDPQLNLLFEHIIDDASSLNNRVKKIEEELQELKKKTYDGDEILKKDNVKMVDKGIDFELVAECTDYFTRFVYTGNDAYLEAIKMSIDAYKQSKIRKKHQMEEMKAM